MDNYFLWSVDPVIYKAVIPGLGFTLELRYYGIFFALMVLGSFFLWRWQMSRAGYKDREIDAWFLMGLASIVIGAHLGHIVFYNWGYYMAHPKEILFFKGRGLSSHGAALGIIAGLLLYSRIFKIPAMEVFDANTFPAALAATLVRLGNFFNHEIVGRVTSVPWAVRFKYFEDHGAEPRHPSQIYEFFLGLVVMSALYLIDRRYGVRRPKGVLAAVFLIVYFQGRFLIEFFKEFQRLDPEQSSLTMGQYLSIPFILTGIVLLVCALRSGPQDPKAWSS
ncbi:MAG: prolipoprotein diacylglyceryl transferase [Deltaproteobacteria bacterium]|nr:prolipoprotein diacylglyceryl transferase [Deltaproteobacteria bacterium]